MPLFVLAKETIIYQEDFSKDPGWTTDNPSNMYWSANDEALFIHAYNSALSSTTPNRYFYTDVAFDPKKSFKLTWRQKLVEADRGAMSFGLYMPDLIAQNRTFSSLPRIESRSIFRMSFDTPRSYNFTVIRDRDGRKFPGSYGGSGTGAYQVATSTWYSASLEFDAEEDKVRGRVVDENTGEVFFETENKADVSKNYYFQPEMTKLGVSFYPAGVERGWLGNNPDGYSKFLIDDVKLVSGKPDPAPPLDPLLEKYAPTFYFHPEEDYFPMNVEAFVNDSSLWDGDTLLKARDKNNPVTISDINKQGSDNWHLSFSNPETSRVINLSRGKEKYDALIASGDAVNTIYARKMEDGYTDSDGKQHDFVVLQYWLFYAMNNWAEHGGFNNHEGDWESVFIFLDKETEEPKYVAFSAHHNDGFNEIYNFAQYDSVRRRWDDNKLTIVDDSVASYVALGSHAMYGENKDVVVRVGRKYLDRLGRVLMSNINLRNFKNAGVENYLGVWGVRTLGGSFSGSNAPTTPPFLKVSGYLRYDEPVKWAGIDKVYEKSLSTATTTFRFASQGVSFSFSDLLPEGNTLRVEPYNEKPTFGKVPERYDFLAGFWDFTSSLRNGTFSTDVTLDYDPNEVVALGGREDLLKALYYNEATGLWEVIETTVDTLARTVTFNTDHFSSYAIGFESVSNVGSGISLPIKVSGESAKEGMDPWESVYKMITEGGLRGERKEELSAYLRLAEKMVKKEQEYTTRIAKKMIDRVVAVYGYRYDFTPLLEALERVIEIEGVEDEVDEKE